MTRTPARFALSLGAGLLAGLLYWLMGVPTPAPPWKALCGLLGILAGEYVTTAALGSMRSRAHPGQTPEPPSSTPER
ncbi:hypothetical protein DDE74_36700 [Streptomyces lydicus]|uniref:XapX domain-containing protein n=1 Tax=Streptomyces lydicus TaxID=47763 RepID=A0A3Q9KEP4_9ACTN|nr:DUF1427 family protein [Streptomyces lydicus]AZS75700.1 hypothetical protein DDE74_36700 [Streptomyces lydicus]